MLLKNISTLLFKQTLLLALVLISFLSAKAQDPQFSQFYANSLYLNPAFAGNTNFWRLGTSYRNQWLSLPGGYVSYTMALDYNIQSASSGVGLLVTRDKAGSGGLRFTNIAGIYSYNIRLAEKITLRTGLKASHTTRDIDASQLVFADQISRGGAPLTIENLSNRTTYLDFGTGLLLHHEEKYWIGMSMDHLNQPNQSLIDQKTLLPLKFSVHGGSIIPLDINTKKKAVTSLIVSGNYKSQLRWDQLDIGVYILREGITFGTWFRGLPGVKVNQQSVPNVDALVLLMGYRVNGFHLGYSYDITISRLARNSGGAHEVSFVYEHQPKKRRKRRFIPVPCARF